MRLNQTSELKVMAVWIGPELRCSISSILIYYVPESVIREKCYDHLNFSRTSIFQFRASRYITGLSRTCISNILAAWIGPDLPCSFSSVSIYYVFESDIRVKSYDHMNFSRTFVVLFWASRYIIGVNRTPMSKVTAVWIRPELPCSILSVSIYYVSESEICVNNYDPLNFTKTSIFEFWVSRYIMGLNRTPMS